MDVLLVNAIAYVLLFLYTIYKYRRINLYNSILFAFVVISVMGYITTKMGIQIVGSVNFGYKASPIPYLFQFVAVLLIVSPFKKCITPQANFSVFKSKNLIKLFYFSSVIFVIVILVKLYEFELVLQQGLAEAYVARHSEGTRLIEFSNPVLTFFSTKGMSYVETVFPIMVYYYVYRIKFRIGSLLYNILLLLMCFIPEILDSLTTGSKGMLFFNAFDLVFFYLFFEHILPSKVKRSFILIGSLVFSFLIFYAVAIQESRNDYDKSKKLASEVILRYLGESMPNLGDLYEDTKVHPYGKRFFPVFTGGKTFSSAEEKAEYWEKVTKARVLNFKTIWGDSFIEFGIVGSFIFLFIVVGIYKKFVFSNIQHFYIFPLIYYYYHKVCIYGIFGVAFVDMRSLQVTLYAVLLCWYLKTLTKANPSTTKNISRISIS